MRPQAIGIVLDLARAFSLVLRHQLETRARGGVAQLRLSQ